MGELIDVAATRRNIAEHLEGHGFVTRGADLSDFAPPDAVGNQGLRFKVGTSYGEVAITPYIDNIRKSTMRILSDAMRAEVKHSIDATIRNWRKSIEQAKEPDQSFGSRMGHPGGSYF